MSGTVLKMPISYGFKKLIKVHEALNTLLNTFKDLEPPIEEVALTEAYGRVACRDIVAPIDVPHFNRSAVDGYAIKAEATFEASQLKPKRFKIIKQLEAPEGMVNEEDVALKISTGQPIPDAFNAVVMLEAVSEVNGFIEVYNPLSPFKNVSRKGEDIRKGEVIVKKGTIIAPQHMGLIASCGLTKVPVYRKIKVLIISSGEEVVTPGKPIRHREIYDSSSYILYGLTKKKLSEPHLYSKSPITSSIKDVLEALDYGLKEFDITIFIGGTSVGQTDIIPRVLAKEGSLLFHGVAMKPGMPTAALSIDNKPVFCLPGPPVACFFSFLEIVAPLIEAMYKLKRTCKPIIKARLRRRIAGEVGKRVYVRVLLKERDDHIEAEPIAASGASILSSLCKAQGYIVLSEDVDSLNEGDIVDVHL
ncbi:MAG: molybdopterin molybdotransferase MoeA, partial [Candidatus Nezhaarchaeales archaeon]